RVRHRIETRSSRAAFHYVDALSEGGRLLSASFGGAGVRVASEGELGPARQALKRLRAGDGWAESAPALRRRILSAFVGDAPELESRGDPRVEETIAFIGRSVSERRISAFELAERVRLSPSRLAVLFRRETGVAIRPFILWTRLQRAVESAGRGKSLTEAAHAAGFADSAHLARTFRRMFGTTLSASVGRLEIRTGRSPHG
ncbi:MAG: helix-turn-helix domain-containing protein, partial [Gemmatimonadetes bacterium]|nr:helix-turn-helix domain-containing protein [Gemmatimonadota bacterium]